MAVQRVSWHSRGCWPCMRACAVCVCRWRCLNVKYLYQKCTLLELFLKELVYEIRSPTLLIKFAAAKDQQ